MSSNKISSETKTAVLNMFKDGESQRKIAEKCGISHRSVGRIIDNDKKDNRDESAKPLKLAVIKEKNIADPIHNVPNPNIKGYVVQEEVRKIMEYIRREIKGVEALTYLIESNDTPSNLENYRKALVYKLASIKWWIMDVNSVKLEIHHITESERKAIHNGTYGIK